MITVIITGGRGLGVDLAARGARPEHREASRVRAQQERELVAATLDALLQEVGSFRLVEGGAAGADREACKWAYAQRGLVTHRQYHAQWKKHGRAAGPIRNREMLAKEQPDLVVAFPGGKGTADMVACAMMAGVAVRVVSLDPPTTEPSATPGFALA